MRNNKIIKRGISFILSLMLALGAMTGCANKSGVSNEDTVINMRVLSAGWGVDYLQVLISKFQEAYAKEGYKINIVSMDSQGGSSQAVNELLMGEENEIDMYMISYASADSLIKASDTEGQKAFVADLSDVYQSKPIKFDKTEENVTLADKLANGFMEYGTYNGDIEEYKGKQYLMFERMCPGGLIVNEELLKEYGFDIPRTTNELLQCVDAIAAKSKETGTYPFAWAGYNASAYWKLMSDVWVAQYSGVEGYNNFLTMNYPENPDEGWRVYEDQAWIENMNIMNKIVHPDNSPNKSVGMDHTTAQHHFMSGDAVFMVNGAWLEREMQVNYPEEAKKMQMVMTPVISALGTKLGLDGKNGTDAALCDKVLSQIVALADENKTVDEIIVAVSTENGVKVTEDQVKTVCERRNIAYEQGVDQSWIVNEYSKKKEIVKLFLRFIASDDAAKVYREYSSSISCYKTLDEVSEEELNSDFLRSVNRLLARDNITFICRRASGLRTNYSIGFFLKHTEYEKEMSVARGTLTGEQIMKDEAEKAKTLWENARK